MPGSYDGSPLRQDGYAYDSLAWHLLSDYGFSVNRTSTLSFGDCPPCEPVTYPLPGYPLFLAGLYALFGRNYLVVKLVQAAIDAATCFLAYLLARRVMDSQRIALLALGLVALNPFTATGYLIGSSLPAPPMRQNRITSGVTMPGIRTGYAIRHGRPGSTGTM